MGRSDDDSGTRKGPLSSVSVFGQHLIIVNDSRIAFDLFEKKSSVYSDRPTLVFGGEMYALSFFFFDYSKGQLRMGAGVVGRTPWRYSVTVNGSVHTEEASIRSLAPRQQSRSSTPSKNSKPADSSHESPTSPRICSTTFACMSSSFHPSLDGMTVTLSVPFPILQVGWCDHPQDFSRLHHRSPRQRSARESRRRSR